MKDFIPRYNHWYSSMVRYPSYYRYGLTALVVCVLCALWYFGLYRYINTKINLYTNLNNAAYVQRGEAEKKRLAVSALPQSTNMLRQEMQVYKEAQCAPNEFVALLMQDLLTSRVALVHSSIETPVAQSFYVQYPIELELQGSCESLINFLKDISFKSKSVGLSLVRLSKLNTETYRIALCFNYFLVQ